MSVFWFILGKRDISGLGAKKNYLFQFSILKPSGKLGLFGQINFFFVQFMEISFTIYK